MKTKYIFQILFFLIFFIETIAFAANPKSLCQEQLLGQNHTLEDQAFLINDGALNINGSCYEIAKGYCPQEMIKIENLYYKEKLLSPIDVYNIFGGPKDTKNKGKAANDNDSGYFSSKSTVWVVSVRVLLLFDSHGSNHYSTKDGCKGSSEFKERVKDHGRMSVSCKKVRL